MSLADEKFRNQRGLQLRVAIVQTWRVRWMAGHGMLRRLLSSRRSASAFLFSFLCPFQGASPAPFENKFLDRLAAPRLLLGDAMVLGHERSGIAGITDG